MVCIACGTGVCRAYPALATLQVRALLVADVTEWLAAANLRSCMILNPSWHAAPVAAALFRVLAADAVRGTGGSHGAMAATLTSSCRSTPCCAALLPQRQDTLPYQLQLELVERHICAGELVLADVAQVRICHRNLNCGRRKSRNS
jgi:hypothetical protein